MNECVNATVIVQ